MAEFVEYLILYFLFTAFVYVCVESGKYDELLIDLMKLKFEIELIWWDFSLSPFPLCQVKCVQINAHSTKEILANNIINEAASATEVCVRKATRLFRK